MMATQKKRKGKAYVTPVFDIVYEDNFLIVVDKKAGFLSVPTEGHSHPKRGERTLIGEVRHYLSIKSGRDLGATPVHRLDRDTSGLLVVAKSQKIALRIKEQFKARKPEREYVAIVKGRVEKASGTFKSFLATDDDLNQYSTDDTEDGKLAITHYQVVEYYPEATRVSVTLETGRRNQIRVHFSEIGHPVIGDVRYLPKEARHRLWPHPRLALHAMKLGFFHPLLKRQLRFEAPLPEEFLRFFSQGGA